MKRVLSIALLALIATTATTIPAQAQYGGYGGYGGNGFGGNGFGGNFGAQVGWSSNIQTSQLQSRINAGIQSGALTRHEASELQAKLNQLVSMEARFKMTGNRFSFRERERIRDRADRLNADITRQLSDLDSRWNNRGRGGYHRGWR